MFGEEMFLHANLNQNFIGEAQITTKDVMTSNGVIHLIDRVLKPPSGKNYLCVQRLLFERIQEAVEILDFLTILVVNDIIIAVQATYGICGVKFV